MSKLQFSGLMVASLIFWNLMVFLSVEKEFMCNGAEFGCFGNALIGGVLVLIVHAIWVAKFFLSKGK